MSNFSFHFTMSSTIEQTQISTTITEENQVLNSKGALSHASTLDPILDFFSKSGALRGKESESLALFMPAFECDKTYALRALFYSRDILHGQGERSEFKNILNNLGKTHPKAIKHLLPLIPTYGRWDDLYALVGTPLEEFTFSIMESQLQEDIQNAQDNKPISLLSKWLKSVNTSSKKSKELGLLTAKYFKMTPEVYRKTLSGLRRTLEIVEQKMCAKNWEDINFQHVPSLAMKNLHKAFAKHLPEKYQEYLASLKKGEAKVNAKTLYPYDIVQKLLTGNVDESEAQLLEAQWKALPNYIEDGEYNAMVVCDVSGSMTCSYGNSSVRPIDVAISLALYIAERNKGPFNGMFITFSSDPEMINLQGDTLKDKVQNMTRANWEGSTDIFKTFQIILNDAIEVKLSPEFFPKKIFIVSDMQFDSCAEGTNFEAIDNLFVGQPYQRPTLVFWNVNAHSDTPVTKDDQGVFLISGASPSILTHALNTKAITPQELMLEVLESERYRPIIANPEEE